MRVIEKRKGNNVKKICKECKILNSIVIIIYIFNPKTGKNGNILT